MHAERSVLHVAGADVLVMPAGFGDVAGVKIVAVQPAGGGVRHRSAGHCACCGDALGRTRHRNGSARRPRRSVPDRPRRGVHLHVVGRCCTDGVVVVGGLPLQPGRLVPSRPTGGPSSTCRSTRRLAFLNPASSSRPKRNPSAADRHFVAARMITQNVQLAVWPLDVPPRVKIPGPARADPPRSARGCSNKLERAQSSAFRDRGPGDINHSLDPVGADPRPCGRTPASVGRELRQHPTGTEVAVDSPDRNPGRREARCRLHLRGRRPRTTSKPEGCVGTKRPSQPGA